MSETTDLVVIEKANALSVFKSGDQIEEILQKVEREVMSFVPDVTTAKGRKEIASLAYKVAQTKTYLDGLGKDLVAELKEIPKLIDGNRKTVRERLDALKDKARQPLTDYEAEQERIKAEAQMAAWHAEALVMNENIDLQRAIQFESDHEIALLLNDKFDRDAAEAAAEAERKRIAHEEELKRQAAEQARQEAEAAAQRERDAAARREAELKAAAENAERLRLEAEQRAEREKQEAVDAANRKAREEADRIKREAEQKEAARLAEEKRIADEAAKRAADVEHRKAINNQALADLVDAGVPAECAVACIKAIAMNKVTAIRITY